jgi:LysR family transcriptional regulator of gallate degradation
MQSIAQYRAIAVQMKTKQRIPAMAQTYTSPLEVEQQLKNLRIFLSVADAKSITQAAEQLFKAPSAITRSIIELERFIGVSLFERKARGMLLNAYGEAVLVRVRRIDDEIRLAADEFLRSRAKTRASSPSAISNLLFNGRKLQLIIHLATYHNISSAAAHMKMTQTGASMALSRLEAALGQSLFQRRMQGMVATDAADRLVMCARRVFAELRHMGSDISAISGNLTGSIVIGTTPLGRTDVFPTAIATTISRYPGLRVTTVESSYEQLIGSLRSGDIDIVFGVLRPSHLCRGLITEPVFTDRLSVVVRAGHPLARRTQLQMSELLTEKWILPRPNALGRPLVEAAFQKQGLQPPVPSVETGDLAVLRQLLNASDMLAVTSPHQLMLEIRSGLLTELPVTIGETREVGVIVRDGAMLSPAALAVLDAVRCQVRERREHQ